MALTAVRQAESTPNVQLILTTMLFAMSDLLKVGPVEEHLAMLDTFQRPGPPSCCTFPCSRSTPGSSGRRTSCRLVGTPRPDASPTVPLSVGCPGPRAQRRGHPRRDRPIGWHSTLGGSSICCPRSSGRSPPTRACACGRSPSSARSPKRDVSVEASQHPRRDGRRRRPALAGQPDVLPIALCPRRRRLHARRPGRGPRSLFSALEPYHERLAIAGLAGISMGPVSGYAGRAAHAAGASRRRPGYFRGNHHVRVV